MRRHHGVRTLRRRRSLPGWTWAARIWRSRGSSTARCSAGTAPRGRPRPAAIRSATWVGRPWRASGPLMNPDMPPVWMTYVNVDSADDTVAKVAANGGTVFMPPMDVMDAGRMAVFADPVGRGHRPVAAEPAHRGAAGQRARHLLLERTDHDGPRRLEGLLRCRVRLGCRRAGSSGRSAGVHRMAALPGGRSAA